MRPLWLEQLAPPREETPLHHAADDGDLREVERLVRGGAHVNVKDEHGWTPLHKAARYGRLEVAQRLLGAGADFNI